MSSSEAHRIQIEAWQTGGLLRGIGGCRCWWSRCCSDRLARVRQLCFATFVIQGNSYVVIHIFFPNRNGRASFSLNALYTLTASVVIFFASSSFFMAIHGASLESQFVCVLSN